MKMKKVLSMLLAMAVATTSVSVYNAEPVFAAEATNTVSNETSTEESYVYGTMNIPYASFFAAEIGTSNDVEVDAVTSATNAKWKNFAGSYSQADDEGEGGKILGAKYNVAIESSVYENLKSANSSLLDSFTESTEVPESYKIMDADGNFSEVKGKSTEAEGVTAEISTSSVWGDYQLTLTGLTIDAQKIAGVVIETTDGTKYGLRHLENIWIKANELAWGSGFKTTEAKGNVLSYAHYESMMGKTISKVTYICTDGNVTVSNLDVYVPVKYNGCFDIADSALTDGASAVTMTGFPEDGNWQLDLPEGLKNASYENGKISYGAGTFPGSYTITAKDADNVYAEVSTSFNITTNTLPVQFKDGKITGLENTTTEETTNFIKNIASVAVKFGDSTANYSATGHGAVAIIAEDGTVNMDAGSRGKVVFAEDGTYELTLTVNGYPDLTFTVEKESEKTYVYGTMNIPYASFFAAEIGTSNDVEVDAVTSATSAAWKKFGGSYTQADEEGEGGKILGAKYNVAIESSVYENLKSANSSLLDSFTESEQVPAAYKIMDANGNFSKVNGTTTAAEGVTATLSTDSVWGDYQLDFTGLTVDAQKIAGVTIETTDGTKYGLRHLENIWIKPQELSWGSGFKLTEAKGNVLSYAHYESMMGKTIDKVTYICTDGNVTINNLNIYVPVKYNGSFEIADSDLVTGTASFTMTGYPEDGDWQLVLPEGLKNASYANGTISYGAETLPGSYTVTAKDASNVYAETSTSFNVKTNTLPVQFKDGKITGLENTTTEETTNFIKNIASVAVKFGDSTANYSATGHGAVAIIAEDGTVNMDAGSRGSVVFAEDGTYKLTVISNGYPELTFTIEKKAVVTPVPTKVTTPTAVPTKAVAPTKAATPTPTAKVTAPKKATISKVSNTSSKKLKVVWKKIKSVSGYQVQIATNKKFTSGKKTYTIKKASTTSKTITGLKKKKTYYVRVRAYNTSGSKKVYGKYSAVKKITIKK